MRPLKLTPAFKDYLWGGTRLRADFGFETDLSPVAEAWVLSCHKDGNSVIENGEFNITFTPEERKPVKEYLSQQKRFKHLEEEQIEKIQKYVDAQCSELGL